MRRIVWLTLLVILSFFGERPGYGQSVAELNANINNVRFANAFSSTVDAGARFTSCLADLPATGGTCLLTGLEGTQNAALVIFIDKPGEYIFGSMTLSMTSFIRVGVSNVTIRGIRGQSILKYTGTASTVTGNGVIQVGVDSSGTNLTTAISNVIIRDLTVDANSLAAHAIYLNACQNCLVDNVEAKNAHGRAIIGVYGGSGAAVSSDVTVSNSSVSGNDTASDKGDGIYFAGVVRPRAFNNAVSNITRIGVLTEQNGSVKSSDALFAFNSVRNAHDHTAPEVNAGYWMENTNGGRFIGNSASDLSGGVQTLSSRCVTIGGGLSVASTFIIDDLDCSGADRGVTVSADALIDAQITNVSVKKGTVSAYSQGVSIAGGNDIYVDGVTCETDAYPNSGSGCVVVALAGNTKIVSVNNIHVGTMTPSGSSADINLNTLGGFTLAEFSVSNLNTSLLGGSALAAFVTNGTSQYFVDGSRVGQTTSSIGGGALGAGACATGTATLPGVATTQVALATPTTYPGDTIYWRARVTSADTVTVYVCSATGSTPTASIYAVQVARRAQ